MGQSTLTVLQNEEGKAADIRVLTANQNVEVLAAQIRLYDPDIAVIYDASKHSELKQAVSGNGVKTKILSGAEGMLEAASLEVDWTMMATVGAAVTLPVLMRTLTHGTTVAIANKESLVCAGPLVLAAAARHGATILPVDSEHNAVFQVLEDQNRAQLSHITITASGGPFLRTPLEALESVTLEQALNHPVWAMGLKNTIDSATMVNKGLEVIEAGMLFELPSEQIEVLIHPQAIVHGMATYADGSVLAHMGSPDMRVPIAHAWAYPGRCEQQVEVLDLTKLSALTFEAPDPERFPALTLARQCLIAGGSAPTVFNAANEVAVDAFAHNHIPFTGIVPAIEKTLSQAPDQAINAIEDVLAVDDQARRQTIEILNFESSSRLAAVG